MYLVFSGPQYTPIPALAPFLPFFEQQPSVYTTGRLFDEDSLLFEDEDKEDQLVQPELATELLELCL